MDVTQIGKEQFGIYHVLIYIVKIGKEELPPTVKVIEGLINASACYEYLVQVADRFLIGSATFRSECRRKRSLMVMYVGVQIGLPANCAR